MGENSKIEWTDHTFNPWRGCAHATVGGVAHPGCDHCYAEAMSKRNPAVLGRWGEAGARVLAAEKYWRLPLEWDFECGRVGERRRVFCLSLGDFFEDTDTPLMDPSGQVGFTMQWARERVFQLMDSTSNLDWLILTKRPENIPRFWVGPRRENVWLGVSVSDQRTADALVPELARQAHRAKGAFLSCEPLLESIDLTALNSGCGEHYNALNGKVTISPRTSFRASDTACIKWVICGGESGPQARPMPLGAARRLRVQCQMHDIPFFFKQWGDWIPAFQYGASGKILVAASDNQPMMRVGKKQAGRFLDGFEYLSTPWGIEVNACP